jgi:fructose-bisphosphate aldolase class II/tagatose 1,6-diphosphate aldolase GatY/KbaY
LKLTEKLSEVEKQNKALLAANYYNLETCKGIIRAAAKLKQPVILQLTKSSIEYMGLKSAIGIGRTVSEENRVQSWLHLDHCQDIDLIKKCLYEGFDSVMIDASNKPFEENICMTKQVVEIASKYDVNVEAELGFVPKPDDKIEQDKFTDPADAERFVRETGVTSLAVAIGSKHGFYKGDPELDIRRLVEIKKITGAFLVLHGGSGIPANKLKEAIKSGITKVNIATDTKDLFMKSLKEIMKNSDEIDLRKVFPLAIDEIQKLIEQKLKNVSIIN